MTIFRSSLLLLACSILVRADILFLGYITTPEEPMFAISVDNDKTSGLLTIGQHFDGFSLIAFEAQTELLTVERNAKREDLHLVHGRIQTVTEQTNPPATKPILISIGGGENISVVSTRPR